jgi:nicotinamidase-related amidase
MSLKDGGLFCEQLAAVGPQFRKKRELQTNLRSQLKHAANITGNVHKRNRLKENSPGVTKVTEQETDCCHVVGDMKNIALLLTSTQNDLLHPSGGAWGLVADTVTKNNVVQNLAALIAGGRAAGIPIIYSPVGIDHAKIPAGHEPTTVIQGLILQNKLLKRDAFGAQFLAELAPQPGDLVLPPRTGFSSFWSSNLDARLKEKGVKTLCIAGMLAHACIESHARDAAELGYQPVVVRDAIGAAGESLLAASLTVLGLHAKALPTTAEILTQWRTRS